MKNQAGNALKFLFFGALICFILVLAAFFILTTRAMNLEPFTSRVIKISLVFRIALIKTLQLLPAQIIFLYIIGFSVLFTLSTFQTESFSFSSIAGSSFGMLLAFIIFLAFSEFLFIPTIEKKKEKIQLRDKIASTALSRAREAYKENELQKALNAINVFQDIDKKNYETNKLYDSIMEKIHIESSRLSKKTEISVPEREEPQTYYQKGKIAYESGDYYSALFYLERAKAIHEDNREIVELYKRTREKVSRLLGALTRDQEKTKRLIQQKEKALNHLEKKEYYEAYHIFRDLHNSYPQLTDLGLYLEEVRGELLRIDFEPKELKELEWLPSFDSIIFLDEHGYINTVQRIISWKGQFYFYNILRYDTHMKRMPPIHFRYGKWIEGRVRLKNLEDFEKLSSSEEERFYIYPSVEPGYLIYLNEKERLLRQLTLFERLELTSKLQRAGIDIESPWIYLSQKFGIFFSVYVLSLVIGGIAWSKRSIYEFPPGFKLIIFLFAVPLLAYILHHLYLDANSLIMYLHRYLVRFAFKNLNIAIYTAIINSAIGVAATIYYLSLSSRVE